MKNTILEFKSNDEGAPFVKLPDGTYWTIGESDDIPNDGCSLSCMLNEGNSVKSGHFVINKVQRETDGEIFEIGDSVIHKDAGDISEITKFVYTKGSGFTVVCLGNNIETVIENIIKTDNFVEQKDKDHKDRKTADFLTSILALLTGNSKEKPLYESLFKDIVTKTTKTTSVNFAGRKEINIIAAPSASVRPEINFHVGKTEYGEDVFMGDQYYTVCTKAIEARNWIVNGPYLPVSSFTTIDVTKAFLSKEDAEHYIIGNKPVFSYKDVSKLLGTGNDPIIIPAHLRGRLIQEAEKRIKNQ